MAGMPRKPSNWGDNLKDIPVKPVATDSLMARGAAPDPATYAKLGEMAGEILSDPYVPSADLQASGLMYNLGQLLSFHRGGPLDAQVRYGGSTPYGNYAFGVYNAARGAGLGDVLDLANLYGALFSNYPKETPMDEAYLGIPAENVENISKGYRDYRNGKIRSAP